MLKLTNVIKFICFVYFRSEQRLSSSEPFYDDEEEEEEILGSDDDEQEDPRDYCKGIH